MLMVPRSFLFLRVNSSWSMKLYALTEEEIGIIEESTGR
jgi:hypothetical protein